MIYSESLQFHEMRNTSGVAPDFEMSSDRSQQRHILRGGFATVGVR